MKFKKGISGNPSGRPRGTKNKATALLYSKITSIIESKIDRLQADIESLEPKDRVRFVATLLNYFVPKQRAIAPYIIEDDTTQPDWQITIVNSHEEVEHLNQAKQELEQARAEFEQDQESWLIEHGYI